MAGSVTGLDAWRQNLQRIEREIQAKAEHAVDAALDEQLNVSNPLTPVKTGYLKSRNQRRWIERGPYKYVGEYFNDAPYAVFVAFGTRRMRARDFVTPGFYSGRKTLIEQSARAVP